MTTIATGIQTTTAGYIRLTRDESLQKGLSAPAQKAEILAYAERSALGEVELFEETEAVGGDIPFDKRKTGRRLIAQIKQGAIRNLIVRDMDRLTRDVQLWIEFTALCFKHSVTVHTFSGPLSFEAPTDEFAALVRAAAAQLERKQTGDRVRHTKRQLAKMGRWPGGPAPFGYQLVQGKLHPHPREAPIYHRIIDLYIQGWGCRRIALQLNDDGELQASGSPWHPDRILRIIQNPVHAGFITHDEANFHTRGRERTRRTDQVRFPGNHDPLITEERWLRVQSIRQARQDTRSVGIARKYALSGILRCACGSPMRAASQQHSKGYAYYACAKRRNYGLNKYGCDAPRVRIDRADAAYWSSIKRLLRSDETAAIIHNKTLRQYHQRPKGADPKDELQKVESRLRIWYDRHDEATTASEQELAWDRIKLLKSRIDELRDEVANHRGEHVPPMTLEQVRKSLHSLEAKINQTQLNDLLIQRYGLSVRLNGDALVISLNIGNDDPAETTTPIETEVRIPGPPVSEWLEENIGKHNCHHCGEPVKVERRHYWRGIPKYHKSCWGTVKGQQKSGKKRPKGYMNGQQVAEYLGIGRTTVGRWMDKGKLPKPKRVDGVLLWSEKAIRKLT